MTDQKKARDRLAAMEDLQLLPGEWEVDAETAAVVKDIARELEQQLRGIEVHIDEPLFTCPITCELLEDPVWAEDGVLYERESIETWIEKERFYTHGLLPGVPGLLPAFRSPMTRKVHGISLTADLELRAALESYRKMQKFLLDVDVCPVPPGMQCAVKAICTAVPGFTGLGLIMDTVLDELMTIDATLAAGDRATAAGFTDAHITGFLQQRGVAYFLVTQHQFQQNRALLRQRKAIFNTGRHWSADRRLYDLGQVFFFLGQQPAGMNLVDALANPTNVEQVASMRDLGLDDESIRQILGQSEPAPEQPAPETVCGNCQDQPTGK